MQDTITAGVLAWDGEPMITIRELLNRIRWDREYGRGEFTIGYYDRVEERIIVVPLCEVQYATGDNLSILLTGVGGEALSIPLHRVCEVYRNGELIWHRERFVSVKAGS